MPTDNVAALRDQRDELKRRRAIEAMMRWGRARQAEEAQKLRREIRELGEEPCA